MESFESHFFNPIKDTIIEPNGIGIIENAQFNAKIIFYVKVENNVILAIDYKVKACPVAIAVASFLAKTFKNKNVSDIINIDVNFINANLKGIPKERLECANNAIDAFKEAIRKARGDI